MSTSVSDKYMANSRGNSWKIIDNNYYLSFWKYYYNIFFLSVIYELESFKILEEYHLLSRYIYRRWQMIMSQADTCDIHEYNWTPYS